MHCILNRYGANGCCWWSIQGDDGRTMEHSQSLAKQSSSSGRFHGMLSTFRSHKLASTASAYNPIFRAPTHQKKCILNRMSFKYEPEAFCHWFCSSKSRERMSDRGTKRDRFIQAKIFFHGNQVMVDRQLGADRQTDRIKRQGREWIRLNIVAVYSGWWREV